MRRFEIQIGKTYLLPVVVTEFYENGNMIRCVTSDDGEVVRVHPEALQEKKDYLEDDGR